RAAPCAESPAQAQSQANNGRITLNDVQPKWSTRRKQVLRCRSRIEFTITAVQRVDQISRKCGCQGPPLGGGKPLRVEYGGNALNSLTTNQSEARNPLQKLDLTCVRHYQRVDFALYCALKGVAHGNKAQNLDVGDAAR